MLLPGGMGPPPPGGHKVGFNTYAMWGLCVVVVGVCYVLEQRLDADAPKSAAIPAEVSRVLPSGAYLMSARARRAGAAAPPRPRRRARASAHARQTPSQRTAPSSGHRARRRRSHDTPSARAVRRGAAPVAACSRAASPSSAPSPGTVRVPE